MVDVMADTVVNGWLEIVANGVVGGVTVIVVELVMTDGVIVSEGRVVLVAVGNMVGDDVGDDIAAATLVSTVTVGDEVGARVVVDVALISTDGVTV